ncbi:MAG: hypothetical protein QOE95_1846 [Gaiellaceae bacterium]|nr:hypothetical protein [Gaiellaceae bacterium]
MNNRRKIRTRRAALLATLAVLALAGGLLIGLSGGGPGRLLPAGGGVDGTFDPLAYTPAREREFEAAAAAGLSHVIYAKSPGGVLAAARRTAAFRPAIEAAARTGPIDADTLEAIVMLESSGRPDVVAGADPSAAAGLTQIVAQTGTGLLGMRIDLPASRRLAARIATAAPGAAAVLRARRVRADQRFDPAAALAATERYLAIAKGVFGRDDLAVESYHMGIGNLETAIRRYAGGGSTDPVKDVVARGELTYARLYVDSTPLVHPAAYAWLAALGDDSATYLWRVGAAREVMRLYRTDPAGLARQAALQTAAASAELALRPPGTTPVLADAGAVAAAARAGGLVGLPASAPKLGLAGDPRLLLAPDALAAALYMAGAVRAIAGTSAPLELTAATRGADELVAASRASGGRADRDALHATGYAFDVARSYATPAEALALQFILDRLEALGVIAWERHARIIHVVAGPRASLVRGVLGRTAGGSG